MPTPKRILLLSDTHGRVHPAIVALAARVELVIHAGDIGNREVLDRLAQAGGRLVAIVGNNDTRDKWPTTDHAALDRLPVSETVVLASGAIVVEHGDRINPTSHRHQRLRQRHPDARMVVYGHSHRPVIDDSDSPWIVNPGAAGRSRTYGGSSCMLLDATGTDWHLEHFRFALSDW